MNALQHAAAAYGDPAPSLRSPRDTEFDAFARVTRALKASCAASPEAFAARARALSDNRRLWAVLALDLADDRNTLPDQTRLQLLNLAQFVMNESDRILGGQGELEVLVDINSAVMRGLRGEGGTR